MEKKICTGLSGSSALPDDYQVTVTADHGGHERIHGNIYFKRR